jgi:rhodanese-related sulfurtransferase
MPPPVPAIGGHILADPAMFTQRFGRVGKPEPTHMSGKSPPRTLASKPASGKKGESASLIVGYLARSVERPHVVQEWIWKEQREPYHGRYSRGGKQERSGYGDGRRSWSHHRPARFGRRGLGNHDHTPLCRAGIQPVRRSIRRRCSRAVNVPAATLFGKEPRSVLADNGKLKVFFGANAGDTVKAAALARLNGYENVAALDGGYEGFMATVMNFNPTPATAFDLSAFRLRAKTEIAALMREQSAPKTPKVIKRVQGGCGG